MSPRSSDSFRRVRPNETNDIGGCNPKYYNFLCQCYVVYGRAYKRRQCDSSRYPFYCQTCGYCKSSPLLDRHPSPDAICLRFSGEVLSEFTSNTSLYRNVYYIVLTMVKNKNQNRIDPGVSTRFSIVCERFY